MTSYEHKSEYFRFQTKNLNEFIGKNGMLAPSVKVFTATHPVEFEARKSGIEFAKSI